MNVSFRKAIPGSSLLQREVRRDLYLKKSPSIPLFQRGKSPKARKLLILSAITLTLCACEKHSEYTGYVEGRLTYVSSPFSGKLTLLPVVRGQTVRTGDMLYQLESQPQSDDLNAAQATVQQISAELADKMTGQRPSELSAISAQITQAKAQVEYAQKDLARKQQLVKQKAIEQNQLDLARQNLKIAEAAEKQAEANLNSGKLPGREEQIKSLQEQLAGANANLEKARWNLSQKTVKATVGAQVFDIYYHVGELAPANQPVLSILAPQDIKVIFFVDEATLGKIKPGQSVQIKCDGCRSKITAKISFISPSAEYTPPVIYSRSASSKLVYEVEAEFDNKKKGEQGRVLNPGESVEVSV
jgi:HlyD family secretion protein